MPTLARKLPDPILKESLDCEAIIHAGDLVSRAVVDELASLGELYAVYGNQDSPALQEMLPSRRVVELNGWRVGIVHGHIGRGMYTEDRATNSFSTDMVDAVVFGHSHVPMNVRRGGVLLFNPGSAVAGRGGGGNTFGILELAATITARIVPLSG